MIRATRATSRAAVAVALLLVTFACAAPSAEVRPAAIDPGGTVEARFADLEPGAAYVFEWTQRGRRVLSHQGTVGASGILIERLETSEAPVELEGDEALALRTPSVTRRASFRVRPPLAGPMCVPSESRAGETVTCVFFGLRPGLPPAAR